MRTRLASLGLAATLLLPLPAAAQVLSRPERAADVIARTTDPAHSSNTLIVSANVLGGYDHNDNESFQPDPTIPVVVDSTSNSTVDIGLQYSNTKAMRTISASVNGAGTFYTNNQLQAGPSNSFNGDLSYTTPIGTATRFTADQRLIYDSLYSFGAFDRLALEAPIGEVPAGGSLQGVAEIASVTSDTSLSMQQRLGRRNSLSGSYGYVRRIYEGSEFGDTSNSRANLGFARQIKRSTAVNASYQYSNGEYAPLVGGGGTRPLVGHVIQGGIDYSKRLSPRRALQVGFGVGATRTDAVTGDADISYAFWAPSAQVNARIDVVRSWAISTNYSLGTTALSGLTREAYSSSAFGVSMGGSIGRAELSFSGGAAWGSTGAGSEVSSDYVSYTGSAQLGIPITKRLSGLVQYTWYQYDVTGDPVVPTGLPPGFSRSSIRGGVSVRLPIIETR